MPDIVFVNEDDEVIGSGPKEEAFDKGIRHRIARIFIFNSKGELFLQKRSSKIKFFPGLWDQSVGGHVDKGEDYVEAALREMEEEVGVTGVELEEVAKFYLEEKLGDKHLYRFNMLYEVVYDGELQLNPDEVGGGKWIDLDELETWVKSSPQEFTAGLKETLQIYKEAKEA